MDSKKLIITSKTNLELKYGSNFYLILELFEKLIRYDKENGITSSIVFIDETSSARKAGLNKAVTITEKNCKIAFDGIYKKRQPDYMVIFGAEDVFPFQTLHNELYYKKDEDDPDEYIASDLPYACNTSYSPFISSYTDPVRVVGRIPDLPISGDIKYVTKLIRTITEHKERSLNAYANYFAVSASEWMNSTSRSLQQIFGHSGDLKSSPRYRGRGYHPNLLKPLAHFYNCHGTLNEPTYYGQIGDEYPDALVSSELNSKIKKGTVVAAECCYGAQLMNPEYSDSMDKSIASNYLFNNAISFLGSSTVAYGPAEGQGLADLICQYFMINVRRGYSTGRALLEARQKFLTVLGPNLDPHEQKTMAQFYILGDPSIHVVKTDSVDSASDTRTNRRNKLFANGVSLGKSLTPSRKTSRPVSNKNVKGISESLQRTGFQSKHHRQSYAVEAKGGKKTAGNNIYFDVYTKRKNKTKNSRITDIEVLVIKRDKKQVLGHKVYYSK